MTPFKYAKWIWANAPINNDDYAEFIGSFFASSREVEVNISSDSIYAIYLNNKLVKFLQCSDFPNKKYYDKFTLPVNEGKNDIKIQVWHFGYPSALYIPSNAGLIFEIKEKDEVLLFSNSSIQSRVMNEFKQNYNKIITEQLGLSFYFDNTAIPSNFTDSVEVDKTNNFIFRDINSINLLDRINPTITKLDNSYLVDLGKEVAGLLDLEIISSNEQEVLISFGEHILDGGVRRHIGIRDFSFEVKLKKGLNKIFNPLRRIAGRYLEIFNKDDIEIKYAGIRPVNYEHKVINKTFDDELLNNIYKTSIDTLELCMHEHYEDCPWREQALYVLDSRNQMLCGYYVFEGYEYQKHNLLLIAEGFKKDLGLLTLTTPCGTHNYPIPFFSLIFIKQVEEYIKYTGDKAILDEISGVLHGIYNTFTSRLDENNLIKYLEKPFWNFYEWTDRNDNVEDIDTDSKPKDQYELIINAAYVYFSKIYASLFKLDLDLSHVIKAIEDTFYDKENNKYYISTSSKTTSQLANAFVLLIGLGNEEIYQSLTSNVDIVEASLSTRGFVYDALLTQGDKYHNFIIGDIKHRYSKMLDLGATSFFETEDGPHAFGGAGSMCHGWSAIPIYYLNIINGEK